MYMYVLIMWSGSLDCGAVQWPRWQVCVPWNPGVEVRGEGSEVEAECVVIHPSKNDPKDLARHCKILCAALRIYKTQDLLRS